MSTPIPPPRREPLSTYVRQNRLTDEEIGQLQVHDQQVTLSMGGVLPEQPDPTRFCGILDVGCGTGNWLIEVAQAYPMIPLLIGIDASTRVIESARAQAEAQQVSDRVQFRVMNALDFLDFPKNSFDLINMRFGSNFLRVWEWSSLLQNWKRISTADGVIRIIEADVFESDNSIVRHREALILDAFYQSGHYFAQQRGGLTSELPSMLYREGFHEIQTHVYMLRYPGKAVEQQLVLTYLDYGFRMLLPFLQKWAWLSGDQEHDSQQLLQEMQQPDFLATVRIHTVCAVCNPSGNVTDIT